MARPTKFEPKFIKQAYKLALLGLTDAEMAAVLDIAQSTFHKWKKDFPKFSESLNAGKAPADAEVAASLFERATGYSHPDTHISSYEGEITRTRITKHYPPDTAAAFIWLKNRQPDRWRNEPEPGSSETPVEPVRVVIEVSNARRR